jgi:hypothetical protein
MKTKHRLIAEQINAANEKYIDILTRASIEQMPMDVDSSDMPRVGELKQADLVCAAVATNKYGVPVAGQILSITLKGRAFLQELQRSKSERSFLRSAWRSLLAIAAAAVAASQVFMAVLDGLRFRAEAISACIMRMPGTIEDIRSTSRDASQPNNCGAVSNVHSCTVNPAPLSSGRKE